MEDIQTNSTEKRYSCLDPHEFHLIEMIFSHKYCFRCAVVTGGNKGIGFEICRQLASRGITVILTARKEERGIEAVQKLKALGLSDVVFHQLDVKDHTSMASLAKFIETNFGKLDILVRKQHKPSSDPTVVGVLCTRITLFRSLFLERQIGNEI